MTGFAIVSTTTSSLEEARDLARALVEARLAACVQTLPIESVYRWKEAVETASEHLLLCKIAATDFPVAEAAIRARHSYDVPEIVMAPITAGHQPYLDWLAGALKT